MITAQTLMNLVPNVALTTEAAEDIIDLSVNLLNLFGTDLPNMAGTAAVKTLSCTSKEEGAIISLAIRLCSTSYVNAGADSQSISILGLSKSSSSSSSSGGGESTAIYAMAKQAAEQLKELEVDFG